MSEPSALYRTSINQLIPSNYLSELLYWRDQINNGAWRVGEIANELFAIVMANEDSANKMDICSAVGAVVGKSGRTIRYYADVAGFFPRDVREPYADVLPFSHFVLAKALGSEPGEDGRPLWQETLDRALDYMSAHQVPPTRERLERLMSGEIDNHNLSVNAQTPPSLPPGVIYDVPPLPIIGEISPDSAPGGDIQSTLAHVRRLLEPIPTLLERLAALRRRDRNYNLSDLQRLARIRVMIEEALSEIDEEA